MAGYPIHDVRVTVYDGKYHPVDSKEVAFVAAGRKAMLDALANAKPTLLEPIVRIEIEATDLHVTSPATWQAAADKSAEPKPDRWHDAHHRTGAAHRS